MAKIYLHTKQNKSVETNQSEEFELLYDDFQPALELDEREADSPLHPLQDLRYGGEDVSGISEWSMRAHSATFDDGLTSGDFQRSDIEILDSIWETLDQSDEVVSDLEVFVRAAEVFVQGKVASPEHRERVIDKIILIPGVKNVFDGLSCLPD